MKNLLLIFCVCAFALSTFTQTALAQSPVGYWKTVDDESGKKKSVIHIYEVDGKLNGRIVAIFPEPDADPNPICTECDGDKKGQPMLGMEIMYGLEQDGDTWEGGKIMDPRKGKVYKCLIEMEDENTLTVRGYIGFSLIGRSQNWYRVERP